MRNGHKLLLSAVLAGPIAMGAGTAAGADIVIGATLAVTGPASFLGDPAAKTLRMMVDAINANGGVNGEQIQLVIYDDGGNPSNARTFATRLIEEDEALAVIGPSTTGATMAVMPLFQSEEVPLISLAGGIGIIDPVQEWVFKTPETDLQACERIFEDVVARGMTTVAMISSNGGVGASMREQCLGVAGRTGVTVAVDELYEDSDADMTPQLISIRGNGAVQAIINPGFGHSSAVVQRNYAQLGLDLPFYQNHGVASEEFLRLAGDAAEGIRLPASSIVVADLLPESDPQRAVLLSFLADYQAAYGEHPSAYAGYAHDALALLVGAIERAGPGATRAQIRDEIEATADLATTTGVVTMSPEDHLGLGDTALRLITVRDGAFALLD